MTLSPPSTERGQRTFHVSDERMHAFAQLTYAQRLQWVEQCSRFVRMAQLAKAAADEKPAQQSTPR